LAERMEHWRQLLANARRAMRDYPYDARAWTAQVLAELTAPSSDPASPERSDLRDYAERLHARAEHATRQWLAEAAERSSHFHAREQQEYDIPVSGLRRPEPPAQH
jgi:hypothetical protein